jgi:hypothetical protein
MKIVINRQFGGFGLSDEAAELYCQLKGTSRDGFNADFISRSDPILVQVVEQLGKKANTSYSTLKIVEIPDGINWHIEEYDGMESVNEDHRSWH